MKQVKQVSEWRQARGGGGNTSREPHVVWTLLQYHRKETYFQAVLGLVRQCGAVQCSAMPFTGVQGRLCEDGDPGTKLFSTQSSRPGTWIFTPLP